MGVLALCLFFLAPPPSPRSFPFLSGLQRWWELTPGRGEPFLPLLGRHRAELSRGRSGPHAMTHPLLLPAAPPAGVCLLLRRKVTHAVPKQLWVEEDDLACLLLEQEVLHGWLLQRSRGSGVQDHAFQVRELGRPLELGGELSAVRKVVSDASECSF